jgi:hypothetical protein
MNRLSSWTVLRCQQLDTSTEVEEEEEGEDDEPMATVPNLSNEWCNDADAWNSDDDEKKSQPSTVTIKKKETRIDIQPETAMLDAMKIEQDDGVSTDEELEGQTKGNKSKKPVSVASADAFSEWKRQNLQSTKVDVSGSAAFPFYYIEIDDEDAVVDEAKLYEAKKMKNKVKIINEHGDDDDDGTMGKE